jgi:hypothetical protein
MKSFSQDIPSPGWFLNTERSRSANHSTTTLGLNFCIRTLRKNLSSNLSNNLLIYLSSSSCNNQGFVTCIEPFLCHQSKLFLIRKPTFLQLHTDYLFPVVVVVVFRGCILLQTVGVFFTNSFTYLQFKEIQNESMTEKNMSVVSYIVSSWSCIRAWSKVKQSLYTPWRLLGGEEV